MQNALGKGINDPFFGCEVSLGERPLELALKSIIFPIRSVGLRREGAGGKCW